MRVPIVSGGIASPQELLCLFAENPELSCYQVRSSGVGFVEIALGEGSLVLVWQELWQNPAHLQPYLVHARSGYSPLILLGTDAEFAAGAVLQLHEQAEITCQTLPIGHERLAILLKSYHDLLGVRRRAAECELLAERYRYQLDELNAIGRALSSERDIDKLLALILKKARDVTGADAGSVYVVEDTGEHGQQRLRFKISQNDSVKLDFTEFTLPVSPSSIVGRCVLSRTVISIPDLYNLDVPGTGNNAWGFQHNRAFDEKIGYRTRSVLTVPMIDARDRVIGVIQLINRKRRRDSILRDSKDFDDQVVPFDSRAQDLAANLASQAGISLENALLYDDIRQLFEGFVRASVSAIESRDPTTSGHSQRVAELTLELARATSRVRSGSYSSYDVTNEELKEIEYATLLHDFGKVGVRESILIKGKKLFEHDRDIILNRFEMIRKAIELSYAELKLSRALELDERGILRPALALLEGERDKRLEEVDDELAFIIKANEPTVLDHGGFERLTEIAQHTYLDRHNRTMPYLRPHELEMLQVVRGSLTRKERSEIESHVVHTCTFLGQIPWGRALRSIPSIAAAHHERLDGSGYPKRLRRDQIPAAARMMAIADMYDALTASDRPYKSAVPPSRALEILAADAREGKLDPELLEIFVAEKVYEHVASSTPRAPSVL
ncbi:MAG: HD domain-containing phosphohydrolase [Pseudomonadota bacterium]